MPTTYAGKDLIKESTKAQSMKNQAANTAFTGSSLEGRSGTLSDDVMSAVRADRQSRGVSRIAQDVGQTSAQLVSDPESIRARTSGMVAPTQVNSLTAGARALNLGTLAEQATQQNLNQGSLDEIIQAGANQLKARAATLMAEAKKQSDTADAIMQQLKFEQSELQRQFGEWATTQQLSQEWAKIGASSGGGGVNIPGVGNLNVSSDVYDAAVTVLRGGDIDNVSMKDNLKGRVQNFISSLTQNPEAATKILGFNPLESINSMGTEAASKLGVLQDIQYYLNTKGGTGPLQGAVNKARATSGVLSNEDLAMFNTLLSRTSGEELFSIGGKTLPAQEKGEITAFIPRWEKDETANVKALDTMYNRLYNEYTKEIQAEARKKGIAITDSQAKQYVNGLLSSRESYFPGNNPKPYGGTIPSGATPSTRFIIEETSSK